MRKQKTKIELQHRVFGTVSITSACRTDSGHCLICVTDDGREHRLLTESHYWLDPQRVQTVFDELYAPIYQQDLRRMRKGERYDVMWRWRRGGKVRPVKSEEPVRPEHPTVAASVKDLREQELQGLTAPTVEEFDNLTALVLGTRGPLRLPRRGLVAA